MEAGKHGLGWALSIGTGIILWSFTSWLGGGGEPWDNGIYWSGAYPLSLIAAAILGYVFPERSWRWALALLFAQLPVMVAGGSGFNLLPLGMILIAVLSLPAILTARVGAGLRRWADAGN